MIERIRIKKMSISEERIEKVIFRLLNVDSKIENNQNMVNEKILWYEISLQLMK
jgi:hypothetical protein